MKTDAAERTQVLEYTLSFTAPDWKLGDMDISPSIEIRQPVVGSGMDGIAFRLYCDMLREHIEPVFGWNLEFQRERFLREYPASETFQIYCGDALSGVLVVKSRADCMHLSLLLIEPRSQRLGIGRAVMRDLVKKARVQSLPITLSCSRSNSNALKFYNALGFRVSREDEVFVEYIYVA